MQLVSRCLPTDLPAQFRLLMAGSLLTTTGFAMAYPFLTLYLNTRLGVPMDRVGLLFIGNGAAGLISQPSPARWPIASAANR